MDETSRYHARRRLAWHAGLLAVILLSSGVATLGYLWFFTDTLRPEGELLEVSQSPSGEWAYSMHYVDYRGASGSPTYVVRVFPVADPQTTRIVYDGYVPGQPKWVSGSTLAVGGRHLDVRTDGPEVFYEPWERTLDVIVQVLLVALPTAAVAVAGGLILRHMRIRAQLSRGR